MVYVLPLLGNRELLLNIKIFFLVAVYTILFLTQPDVSIKDTRRSSKTDRYSVIVILVAAALSQIVMVIEWGYFNNKLKVFEYWLWPLTGFIFLVSGTIFRIWSIQTLGRFFTATVQLKEGHQIVKTGPYAFVRHPSYLGSHVAIIGSGLFLQTTIGTLFAAFIMYLAYRLRIRVEEQALVKAFGVQYTEYQRSTKRLIPLLW